MVLLDLFSGIGGFHLGLTQAGINFNRVYYSEIEPTAEKIYKTRFPEAEGLGDVRSINDRFTGHADIVTAGFPCQDISRAGKRSGIAGERSSLGLTALNIIFKVRPKVFIIENVPDFLSINGGNDARRFFGEIVKNGLYDIEWDVIDCSRYVPQARKRLFIIGHHNAIPWSAILPFGSGTEYSKTPYTKIQAGNISHTLTCNTYNDRYGSYIVDKFGVRTLTEIECERIQGFPDNWTEGFSFRKRIKVLGNAVPPPVVAEIGKGLIQNLLINKQKEYR